MPVVDYTRFNAGRQTSRGRIARCPVCGKNGVRLQPGASVVIYIHRTESSTSNSSVLTSVDKCEVTVENGGEL